MAKKVKMKAADAGTEKAERLPPTPAVIKKLFAYSGNQCAIPGCVEPLVDPTGTMLGKIAHICAAEAGGPRFEARMSNEERRAFDNLIVVCGRHHDVIDDPANAALFPKEILRKHKMAHEGRFKEAERQLLAEFVDATQVNLPTYPKTLKGFAKALDVDEIADHPEEIEGICAFIGKLKEVPLDERNFALKLAERMRRQNADVLPVDDVRGAFNLGVTALKRHMGLLEHHLLGSIEETNTPGKFVVKLWDRDPGGNPWIEILEFCDATGNSSDELIRELNFALYDG